MYPECMLWKGNLTDENVAIGLCSYMSMKSIVPVALCLHNDLVKEWIATMCQLSRVHFSD